MPRTVVISPNVRRRLCRYIYNITINPVVEPKYKVGSLRRALEKANKILDNLYMKLSIDNVTFKQTQFRVLGKQYGYRQYQYKDKTTKTTWLFGCDTTPSFNFVMIMENSKLCFSHTERVGNLIIENKQYNTMSNTKKRIRLTESDLHKVIKRCVNEALNEISPVLAARYEGGRQAQADNATNPQEKFKYQQKANAGRDYAQNAWNKQYGFDINNGPHSWYLRKMRGIDGLAHGASAKYGVDFQNEFPDENNGYSHLDMSYNPRYDTYWAKCGDNCTSEAPFVHSPDKSEGYYVAHEMEKGSQEVYDKYRNRGLNESIRRAVRKVLR